MITINKTDGKITFMTHQSRLLMSAVNSDYREPTEFRLFVCYFFFGCEIANNDDPIKKCPSASSDNSRCIRW